MGMLQNLLIQITYKEMIKDAKTVKEFINGLLNIEVFIKRDDLLIPVSDIEKEILKNRVEILIQSEFNGDCILLTRGTKKYILNKIFISKLNSNDSLFDGLFLVGEKAKNYLNKSEDIPHPIKVICETGQDVIQWIFDEYSNLNNTKYQIEYFKDPNNKSDFIKKLKDDHTLIDYYLFGLHTLNSDSLLNFVSSTRNPNVALSHENDLIIIFWLSKDYEEHAISEESLKTKKKEIEKLNLPIFMNSYFPEENEYSLKGFILPHFILGVYDLNENRFIINPPLIDNKKDWILDGFDIDRVSFKEFITQTKYKRFLTLIDRTVFIEKKVC